ncbi:uncharacterized protein LOC125488580 isoform X1 [Plutella xylostella]|uniref:uncharacterized protein LOC125488580 isoform X1 n=1 Tax=Plutella xylostella TaxID=51655 RepID=UPI002033157B|nr:uncharacterized protein LOC125488580 isoform X1 [Plutella xylostella]
MASSDSDSSVICDIKLKTLIKKRGVVKGKLTLFKKYLSKLTSASLTADQLIDLELRTTRIINVFKEFEIIQDKIETLSEELKDHLEERETFENTYFECVSLSKGYLAQVASPGASTSPEGQVRDVTEPREHDSIKYPDIKLPTYNGQVTDWIEFRDTFDALVNQTSLKPIQKFKYLKGCLTDSALEVVSSLEFAEESHALAWQLLCERYNNPKTLVYSHLRALFNIDPVPNTATALRSLNDNISKHLRILRSVKVPTNDWDLLIIFFLTSKLDRILQTKWEEKMNSRELPNLQDFKSFLRSQADLREAVSQTEPATRGLPAAREAMVTTCPPSHTNSKVIPKHTYRRQCPNCKETHYINQCPKLLALNAASRIRIVKRLGLCLNCLASNHIVPNCRASNCRICQGKHHTLLHITHTDSNESNQRQSTFHNSSGPTAAASVPQEPHSINLITNNQQLNSNQGTRVDGTPPITQNKGVILSTARVKVFDKDNKPIVLRVLLDSGSQSNFLTESACNKLNLTTHQLNIEILGFNQNLTKINQSCNLTIHSNDDSFSTKLSCLIVPKICKLSKHTVDARQLNIPKRFRLADELFYEDGEIDLLIGAEHFYQLLCIGQHSLGTGLPILVRTKLGYVVSGSYSLNSTNMPHQVVCNFVQIAQNQALQTFNQT